MTDPHVDPAPDGDNERLRDVMRALHDQGYYAPDLPWGKTSTDGLQLIPPERRDRYVFYTEAGYHRAAGFGDTPTPAAGRDTPGEKSGSPHPLVLHWAGEGAAIAGAFHRAAFFVRWEAPSGSSLYVSLRPFEGPDPPVPVWAPSDWERLRAVLWLLQRRGVEVPLVPVDPPGTPGTGRMTFGPLERALALSGSLDCHAAEGPFRAPLLLTWQGDGAAIAATFHRAGFDVWWRGDPAHDGLMGVAPRERSVRVISRDFPPWQP